MSDINKIVLNDMQLCEFNLAKDYFKNHIYPKEQADDPSEVAVNFVSLLKIIEEISGELKPQQLKENVIMTKEPLNSEQREIISKAKELFNDFFDTDYEEVDLWEKGRLETALENLFDLIDDLFPEPKPPEPQKLYLVRIKENKQVLECFTSEAKAKKYLQTSVKNLFKGNPVLELVSFIQETN